ncbi:MAG: NADH-quinone oxidoreductase subunit J [Pseudomonadales bacterium]|jgi:NADH-quinone oxidoreductase subunit J|nr:NADH-quinone oxidoreductase subunit J [Gammaproteobacteria bacterium]MBP6480640.1 NADH-quinone oxidoreductase subunit J [Pseudomonadales bacterium]MBP7908652.1 NADH-quinone oxidoreductase subunit J [Pseudomonadales bacterium]HQY70163.1 NADH-quinone oxidoreductase subunit J [Pseudomonadales bacterium]
MELTFYTCALVAILATLRVVTNANPVHALLYLVVSLLAVAGVFFALGAPFAGALEVIVYAGAIMVLFVFIVMMLNLGPETTAQERQWLKPATWIGPMLLSALLLGALVFTLVGADAPTGSATVGPKAVGIALFGPYVLVVELASLLLLGALVAAYHLGRDDHH